MKVPLKILPVSLMALALFGQANTGELRVFITDADKLPVPGSVELVSQSNGYRQTLDADRDGHVTLKRLSYGMYRLLVSRPGLSSYSAILEIRSAIPKELRVTLSVAPVETSVSVTDNQTLIDPHSTSSANRVGRDKLDNRLASLPGRSLAELVNSEPGEVFEANGVLHPRGSEYQVQYVMDGLPLTENRSVAYSADVNADDVQEMSVMTAGFPAEYGRKLGGVIEVVTARDKREGFHGKAIASGGSFETADSNLQGQYGWGRNTLSVSAAASTTNRFLDPPVLENFTNHGSTADFMAHYERDLSDSDRIGFIVRRGQSKFQIPDELIQDQAGQRQDRNSFETAIQFSYDHIFSPNVLGDIRAMGRDINATLWSNGLSTPVIAAQDRSYREGYVKATVSAHSGVNEFKFGGEGDFATIREALHYSITDPSQFDPDTPPAFQFQGKAPDREQSGFGQDQIRFKNLTISAGLRFDHYNLLVEQSAWSPRLGIAYYWPAADIVFRASYDKVFQTPAFENLLVSSSSLVTSLSDQVLRLPVQPSRGDYWEAGFAKGIGGKIRLDGNLFHRQVRNYADDDLLLNTGVNFPIAFSRAVIYGAEVKVEMPHWGPFSGYVNYSNLRGNGFLPVTGGLFLGSDAAQAISGETGVFAVTQDQRNTVRARLLYRMHPRLWVAADGAYDSGLPVEFDGTYQDAAAQYGASIVNRVNFSAGRARPSFALNAAAGATLLKREKQSVQLQLSVENLTDRLNVIDFSGLFSGTALAPSRSAYAKLQFEF